MEISKHLFISDTNSVNKTKFTPFISNNQGAKIINKSNRDICLDFVLGNTKWFEAIL